MVMIGYVLDRGGPKDSKTAPNSFLKKINEKGFWRFATDIDLHWAFDEMDSLLDVHSWPVVQNVTDCASAVDESHVVLSVFFDGRYETAVGLLRK